MVIDQSPDRAAIMQQLFGDGAGDADLKVLRVPFGGTDLSTSRYSYDDVPYPETDLSFSAFALPATTTQYTIPFLQAALAIDPKIKLTAVAWSAPAWMKDGGELYCSTYNTPGYSGMLIPSDYTAYAQYLVDAVNAFAHDGIDISDVSVSNEPGVCAGRNSYPTMILPASTDATVAEDLRSALNTAGDAGVSVVAGETNLDSADAYDSNSSLNGTNYPQAILSSNHAAGINAYGYHCYSGTDWARQTYEHQQFPGVQVLDTECASTWNASTTDLQEVDSFEWQMQNQIIDPIYNWSSATVFWAAATDQNCGPDLSQSLDDSGPCGAAGPTGATGTAGCADCQGLIKVDNSTTPSTVTDTPEYLAAEMTNEVAEAGATVLTDNTATQNPSNLTGNYPSVNYVAFKNPDGTYGLVFYNPSWSSQTINIDWNNEQYTLTIPDWDVESLKWPVSAPVNSPLGSSAAPTYKAYRGRDQKGAVRFRMQIRYPHVGRALGVPADESLNESTASGGKAPRWTYRISDLTFATGCSVSGTTVAGVIEVSGRTRNGQRSRFSLRTRGADLGGYLSGSLADPKVSGTLKVLKGSCSGEKLRFTAHT
jgi:glucosylceramidase